MAGSECDDSDTAPVTPGRPHAVAVAGRNDGSAIVMSRRALEDPEVQKEQEMGQDEQDQEGQEQNAVNMSVSELKDLITTLAGDEEQLLTVIEKAWKLADRNEYGQRAVLSQGVVSATISVMREHEKNPGIQGHGLTLLCHAAMLDSSEDSLCRMGIVDLAIDSMRAHPDDPGVQWNALGLLQNLAQTKSISAKVAHDSLDVALGVLKTHQGHPTVTLAGLGLLSNLVEDSPVRAQVVRDLGGREVAERALHHFDKVHHEAVINGANALIAAL